VTSKTLRPYLAAEPAYKILMSFVFIFSLAGASSAAENASELLNTLGLQRGICAVIGDCEQECAVELAQQSEALIYIQSSNREHVTDLRASAAKAGLLGTRIYVELGSNEMIHLADNLADGAIVVGEDELEERHRAEVLRAVHPGAKVLINGESITKPRPFGADDWSHPYHGPDNNPQSRDANAKAPYLTQFLSEPWYVPMPQVTVSSGGRVYKAFGHIALKEREWPWLNTLVAINGYNGTHLWNRKLKPGFMVHRNNLIATPDTLFVADDESCKLLDATIGALKDEIVIHKDIDSDGVWKWMALDDGVLYALVGATEKHDTVIRGARTKPGWPWSELGKGYGGQYSWGFGRTLIAIDPRTKKTLWTYKSNEPIDSRALCMASGRLFVYSHQKYLAAVDAKNGDELWKTSDKNLLNSIGQHDRAQTARKGFASTSFAKANEKGVYFAGPQRTKIVAVSAKDGSLMWDYDDGNFQLVLREDGLYAMGRMQTSKKFNYLTGEILADLDCYRGNCTRATGTVDSIFTRGYRHTGTMRLDLTGNYPRRIPLMRPACQDGVIVSDGQLYWGPWMCDCNHSLIGMISLAPAGDFDFAQSAHEDDRLQPASEFKAVTKLEMSDADWTSYRSDGLRQASSPATIPSKAKMLWQIEPPSEVEPTAPVTAGGLVFWSGMDGIVRAADSTAGKIRWAAYTGGAVRFPPEIWNDRVYVGSSDGWIYCFEADTGNELWRFRAAPAERKIAVHGRLLSNWPVASGVLVYDGVVYAAAGITSYDGTHVYALDAVSGNIRWQNNTSGRLVDDQQVTGVSVQGHLLLHENRLYLAGGNVVSPAIYDLDTGKCLNQLNDEWATPETDLSKIAPGQADSKMFHRSPRGRELFLVDGEVRVFDQLLYSPPKYGPSRYFGGHFLQAQSGERVIRATSGRIVRLKSESPKEKPVGLWQSAAFQDPLALALCRDAVVVAGQAAGESEEAEYELAAISMDDGTTTWSHKLPVAPVSWGVAVDRNGGTVVTLVDGRVMLVGDRHD